MVDTVREQILQSLAAQVANITTANLYEVNVVTVDRARQVFFTDELPAVGIFDLDEEPAPNYGASAVAMNIRVEMHSEAGAVNRSVHGNIMLGALKKGLMSQDTEHGGLAERTYIASAEVRHPDEDDETMMAVYLSIVVVYSEAGGDPYTVG